MNIKTYNTLNNFTIVFKNGITLKNITLLEKKENNNVFMTKPQFTIIIDKNEKDIIDKINNLSKDYILKNDFKMEDFKTNSILKDGDDEDRPLYPGYYYFTAKIKPGTIVYFNGKKHEGLITKELDEETKECYNGTASIRIKHWKMAGEKQSTFICNVTLVDFSDIKNFRRLASDKEKNEFEAIIKEKIENTKKFDNDEDDEEIPF